LSRRRVDPAADLAVETWARPRAASGPTRTAGRAVAAQRDHHRAHSRARDLDESAGNGT